MYDQVIRRLKDRMETLIVGDPLDKNTDIGAINSAAQLETIEGYLELGKQAIYETDMELRDDVYYLTHQKFINEDTKVIFTFRQRHKNREIFLVQKASR